MTEGRVKAEPVAAWLEGSWSAERRERAGRSWASVGFGVAARL